MDLLLERMDEFVVVLLLFMQLVDGLRYVGFGVGIGFLTLELWKSYNCIIII
jgi:hypothetical protein